MALRPCSDGCGTFVASGVGPTCSRCKVLREGAADERARVVAWLRTNVNASGLPAEDVAGWLADLVERGEHAKGER